MLLPLHELFKDVHYGPNKWSREEKSISAVVAILIISLFPCSTGAWPENAVAMQLNLKFSRESMKSDSVSCSSLFLIDKDFAPLLRKFIVPLAFFHKIIFLRHTICLAVENVL